LPDARDSDKASIHPVGPPTASIVIPTKDRPTALDSCLYALSAQTIAEHLELIVVDDGSIASEEVSVVVGRHRRARLIRSSGAGPAAARNEGARQSRGRFLCFTDDDCVPRPDWAEHLVDALERGADAVAGTTLSGGGAIASASEVVARAPTGARPAHGELAFAPSNNLACTRSVFDATPFDDSFPDAAGEDRDWCARLKAAGYVLRSEPKACLVHRQDLTFPRFLRQQVRYGQGAFRFRQRDRENRRLEHIGFYIALVRRGFRQGFAVGLLVGAAQAATVAGFVSAWATKSRDGVAARRVFERDGP
jgi:glycosyltransferase involved in cell wall biosynthesis